MGADTRTNYSKTFLILGITTSRDKTMTDIQDQIKQEVEEARSVCDNSGGTSAECAAAWDAVEELQAEASHQRQAKRKNSLEQYCDDNPDAAECRIYED
jgi:CP12 domain